jgi:hypothetical protein
MQAIGYYAWIVTIGDRGRQVVKSLVKSSPNDGSENDENDATTGKRQTI